MLDFTSVNQLKDYLTTNGCKLCSLGFQPGLNGCCVSRGNPNSRRMIIGEAAGRIENEQHSVFVGPAGQLLDKVFNAVGFNTNQDFYLTNIVLCRPIAEKGSGKENYTPKMEQRKRCKPYLDLQIKLIQPKIIVTLGKPATETILGMSGIKMGDYRGQLFERTSQPYYQNQGLESNLPIPMFAMLHPAALLHAQGNKDLYEQYREQMWSDILKLKQIITERNL